MVVARGHHASSHDHVGISFALGTVLKIVVLNYVDSVIVYLFISVLLGLARVVVVTVLWRSDALCGTRE